MRQCTSQTMSKCHVTSSLFLISTSDLLVVSSPVSFFPLLYTFFSLAPGKAWWRNHYVIINMYPSPLMLTLFLGNSLGFGVLMPFPPMISDP